MRPLLRQEGSALILIIAVIATLGILTTALVVATGNMQKNTSGERQRNKAFNVAEAGLDAAMYSLASTWPSDPAIEPMVDQGTFRNAFDQAEFPEPTGGQFIAVDVYDDLEPIDPDVQWDSNGNDIMWVESQSDVGSKSARIRAQVEKTQVSLTTFASGCLLYAGGDAVVSGARSFNAPTGNPAALLINGRWQQSGAISFSNVVVKEAPDPDVPPSIDTLMPPEVVQSLVDSAQVAQPMGTEYPDGLRISGAGTYTYPGDIYIQGDLRISGANHITFGNVYVDGDVQQSGAATLSFGSLYVTGDLDVSGATVQHWGPTYVTGDVDISGAGNWEVPLFVAGGHITLSGACTWGGDGVGGNRRPCIFMTVGSEKTFRWSGASTFSGIMINMDGPVEQSGAGAVRGSILAGGDINLSGRAYTASGAGTLTYDQNVVGSLQTSGGAIVRTLPDTWQEIQPTAAPTQ